VFWYSRTTASFAACRKKGDDSTASGRAGDGGTSIAPAEAGATAVGAPLGAPVGGHTAAAEPPRTTIGTAVDSTGVGAVKRGPSSDGDGTTVPDPRDGTSSEGLNRLWNESRICACRVAGASPVAAPVPGVPLGNHPLDASGVDRYSIPHGGGTRGEKERGGCEEGGRDAPTTPTAAGGGGRWSAGKRTRGLHVATVRARALPRPNARAASATTPRAVPFGGVPRPGGGKEVVHGGRGRTVGG